MHKYRPFIYLLSIVLAPIVFLIALFYLMDMKSFHSTILLSQEIFANLKHFKSFKLQIHLAFIYALTPLIFTIYLFFNGVNMNSHGRAKWASIKDIETYKYSLVSWVKSICALFFLSLFAPLSIFAIFKRHLIIFCNERVFEDKTDFRIFDFKTYYNTLKIIIRQIFYENLLSGLMLMLKNQKTYYQNLLEHLKGSMLLGLKKENPITLNFDNGLPLGVYNVMTRAKVVYYNSPLSTLIIAPPGSGKTAAVAVPNLLNVPSSCVVLDIKGELFDLTAGYRQQVLKNKIFVFDPLGNDNTLKFNPFDKRIVEKLDFNRKRRLVDEVGNTIFAEDGANKDPHWTQQAKNLFVFYALYDLCVHNTSTFFEIASAPIKNYVPLINPQSRFYTELYECQSSDNGFVKENGRYIAKVENGVKKMKPNVNVELLWYQQVAEQVYTDPENPKNYDGSVNHLEKDDQGNIIMKEGMLDPIIRNEANKWAKANDKEFASIKSVYSRFMQVFTSYQVKSATDSMSFEYEDLRADNISLYIKIAQTDIDTLAPLIRILLESIAKNLLLKESKKFEERVYLFLDEFVRFGKLPFLLEMPALSRSYDVVLIFITQSNALIEKYYGREDARIVNSTVAYKIIFKMDDLEYAKQVSEEVGKMTRKTRSHSTEKGQLITGGTSSIGKEAWDLLSAQDIMNIDKDEVIVLVSGHKAKPLKLKANYYFKNKELLSRINWEVKPNEEVFD
ncbi:type IV secretory system conjugative DNA transfer family protein [Helicobacter pylori]|nr:type IV secretory system conjugative DNA transfer family protein [Helicobacter pylori]